MNKKIDLERIFHTRGFVIVIFSLAPVLLASGDVDLEAGGTLVGADQTVGSRLDGDLLIRGDLTKTTNGKLSLTGDTIEFLTDGDESVADRTGTFEDIFLGDDKDGKGQTGAGYSVQHTATGDIELNVGRDRGYEESASIISQDHLTIIAAGGSVKTERYEKILANGDVTINATNDALIGDIGAVGDLRVISQTGQVVLLNSARTAGFMAPATVTGDLRERGINYIADTIDFGSSTGRVPVLSPELQGINNGDTPTFATPTSFNNLLQDGQGIDEFTASQYLSLTIDDAVNQTQVTNQSFGRFGEPIPPERDPATEEQAELAALQSEVQTAIELPQVGSDLPLFADQVMRFLECSLPDAGARCELANKEASTDYRLRTDAAVAARQLYRMIFTNPGEIMTHLDQLAQLFEQVKMMHISIEDYENLRTELLESIVPEGKTVEELDNAVGE